MSDGLERRLTTLLAADIAEYSRLVREDEEGTVRALRSHRDEFFIPLIAKYGGRIANTAGDSILAEFPSTVEAVRCAVAIQDGLAERNRDMVPARRIRLRIGINIGDVVTDGADLLGDGVNVAARLEGIAEPESILVSRAVRDQVRDHLELELEDLGDISVKNIARPVRAFKVLSDATISQSRENRRQRPRLAIFAAAAVIALISVGAVWMRAPDIEPVDPSRLAFALPAIPSLAVLPFKNLSGDPSQDFLAVSFSEDILTSLSRLSGLFVISGSTTSHFTGDDIPLGEVAEELGIRYVLTGNLQRDRDEIRISARLVDAISGRFVWSDRYESDFSNLFSVKDAITLAIIADVGAKLELGERDKVRGRETKSLEAWLLQREGYRKIQNFNAEGNTTGRDLLNQAIAIDPTFATAYSNLALSHRLDAQFSWVENKQAAKNRALVLYQKALKIDPDHGPAMAGLASWHLSNGDVDRAVEIARRAVPLEPSDYFVHALYGWTLIHAGQAEEAVAELEAALRLSPRAPDWVVYKLAEAHLVNGDPTQATKVAKGLLNRPPSSPANRNLTHIINALALRETGQIDEAREEVARAIEAYPKRTLAAWRRQRPYADKEIQSKWSATLEELGMPQGK